MNNEVSAFTAHFCKTAYNTGDTINGKLSTNRDRRRGKKLPSMHYLKPLILFRVTSRSQLTLGDGGVRPGIRRKFIIGLTHWEKQPFTLTFTPADNLEYPINPNLRMITLITEV